jgi:hypothetical protein
VQWRDPFRRRGGAPAQRSRHPATYPAARPRARRRLTHERRWCRAEPAVTPQRHHRRLGHVVGAGRAGPRPARPVHQPGAALLGEPPQPLVGGRPRDAHLRRDMGGRTTSLDTLHQEQKPSVTPACSASRSPRPSAIFRSSATAAPTSSGFRLTCRPAVPASRAVVIPSGSGLRRAMATLGPYRESNRRSSMSAACGWTDGAGNPPSASRERARNGDSRHVAGMTSVTLPRPRARRSAPPASASTG